MQAVFPLRAGCFGLICMALVGCDDGGTTFGQQSFQTDYAQARDALETGNFTKAERGYAKLMGQAGPLAPRLQLEYAHVLLRKNDYESAANAAETAGQRLTGAGQAAALAVQGTAHHEIGMAALNNGDTAKGAKFLQSADSTMAQVLATHPDLDPMGALAARRAAITVQLKSIQG